MRPPEFTGGNTDINAANPAVLDRASMRPPEFTGGNPCRKSRPSLVVRAASMRPPEFTGGNATTARRISTSGSPGFNEAAGIHRRKLQAASPPYRDHRRASMRPPEFTGGNPGLMLNVLIDA